ncbi:Tudor domain-containing protein 5 [Araneus ventricosus]|uniref:Tudor domain-containing protein 5 n=1 Tax=Araneus ventricosus TaxID=182803 RepID=A0A4Y2EJ60_ARAVE|nr:Tudor domain-containing protein 5 [Araneus ventricosus]
MDEPDEYEIAKMEIRGLLISNKEGCCLSEFKKQYRSMLGRALPFVQLGYKNEIELLSAMPDAVRITSSGRDYYLYGIADEKSKHIQKMVSKQKPSKKKPLGRLNPLQRYHPVPSSAPRRSYELPPSSTPRWSNELASAVPRRSNVLPPSSASRRSNELPPSSAPRRSSELYPSSAPRRSYELPPRFQTNAKMKKELPQFVMNEVTDLVCKYPAGLSLRDVLEGYRRFYDKELPFKDYGFFTLQECLEEIPSLILKPKDNDTLVFCSSDSEKSYSESSKTSNKVSTDNSSRTYNQVPKISEAASSTVQSSEGSGLSLTTALNRPNFELPSYDPFSVSDCSPDSSNHLYSDDLSAIPSPHKITTDCKYNTAFPSFEENHNAFDLKTKSDQLDDFTFNTRESPEDSPVSENIRNNLIRVIENCPHGIWAREFPTLYKEITKTEFDLHSFGFYDLASFVDSVPDIFTRRSLPNSKKDYLIYPAWTTNEMDREDPKSAAFAIEIIIVNTRKILQANQEGVTLKEFLYVYSLNCSEPLYFVDLGFDSLENLLVAIADRVPLKFQMKEGVKSVHLVVSEEKSLLPLPVDLEPLPSSVVSPFKQFTQQTLPPEMDLRQFFPVYVSSVINPEHIYIQLQGEDTSEALIKKYQDLEKFYSSQSKSYLMKDVHIAAGSIGVALWPADMLWYRIRIMSVTSPETVRVFYVDYGTIEVIPKTLLRYIREEFFDFPTQAIKASLAYVKPPLGDNAWNPKAKSRILKLCTDITVMAKIHDIEQDGLLSVVLCDTNGEEDVYINDVLLKEHLACTYSESDSNSQCRTPQCVPEIPPPTLPAPKVPSTNTADPTQVFGMLLQAYSSLAANKASPTAAASLPIDPAVITAALAQAAQSFSQNTSTSCVDFSSLFQAPSTFAPSPIPCPKPSGPPPADDDWQFPPTSLDFAGETASRSSYTPPSEDSEVFDDVDDAFFDEFYQKVSLVTKRYVKRIRTGDGYMFHILIYETKPFVSCGDICSLIWSNKDSDYLLQRLQNQETVLTNTLIWESQNEDMFDQLRRFHVKGFKELNDQTCILVYPLNALVKILNVFGHPSAELRSRILNESSSFNPKHPMWMELSEVEIPDGEEEFAGKTDDDKLNRLCLYDLQTMRQGIRIRRQNLELRRSKSPDDVPDEEEKLRLLYNKVIGRIKEIKQICSNFADS